MEVRLPEPGLLRWLWGLALGELALRDGLSVESVEPWGLVVNVEPEDFMDALGEAFSSYMDKSRGTGPRLSKQADKRIFGELGLSEGALGEAYAAIFSYLQKLVKDGFDVEESLGGLRSNRGKRWIGLKPTFVTPAFLKNMEYFERRSGFLTPSGGASSMIEMDALWLSLLLLGFYIGFAGFYGGGAVHLVLKEDIERYLPGPRRLLEEAVDTVKSVAEVAAERRRVLDVEEVYEMDVALGLAGMVEKKGVVGFRWPVTVVRAKRMGNVYVVDKVVHLRLERLVSFAAKYLEEVGKLRSAGYNVDVKLGDGNVTPLEWLVSTAEREVTARGRGGGEAVALITVKDLYRAVEAGSLKLVEEALLRLARRAAATRGGNGGFDYALNVFVSERHLGAVLNAAQGAVS